MLFLPRDSSLYLTNLVTLEIIWEVRISPLEAIDCIITEEFSVFAVPLYKPEEGVLVAGDVLYRGVICSLIPFLENWLSNEELLKTAPSWREWNEGDLFAGGEDIVEGAVDFVTNGDKLWLSPDCKEPGKMECKSIVLVLPSGARVLVARTSPLKEKEAFGKPTDVKRGLE